MSCCRWRSKVVGDGTGNTEQQPEKLWKIFFWFRAANRPANELAKLTDNEPKMRSDRCLKPLLNIGFKNAIISLTSNI